MDIFHDIDFLSLIASLITLFAYWSVAKDRGGHMSPSLPIYLGLFGLGYQIFWEITCLGMI